MIILLFLQTQRPYDNQNDNLNPKVESKEQQIHTIQKDNNETCRFGKFCYVNYNNLKRHSSRQLELEKDCHRSRQTDSLQPYPAVKKL